MKRRATHRAPPAVAPAQARKAHYFKYQPAILSRPEAISYNMCLALVFCVSLILLSAERLSIDVVDKAVAEFLAAPDEDPPESAKLKYSRSFFEQFARAWPAFLLAPACVLLLCPLIVYFTTKSGNVAYYVSGLISIFSYVILVTVTALVTAFATKRPAPRFTAGYAPSAAECVQEYASVFRIHSPIPECVYDFSTPASTTLIIVVAIFPIPCLIQHVYSLLMKLRPDFTRGFPRVACLLVYILTQTTAITFVVLFTVIAAISDLATGRAYFTDCLVALAYAMIYLPVLQLLRADYVGKMTLAMEIVENKAPVTSFDDLA